MSVVLGKTRYDDMNYYITGPSKKVIKTVELSPGVLLDKDIDGSILGLESFDDVSLRSFLDGMGFTSKTIDEDVDDYLTSIS